MSGLYWSAGLMFTSKSAKMGAMLGAPDAEMLLALSVYTFGLDVWVGTIGNKDVVKTSEATGFHSATLLNSCDVLKCQSY